MGRPPHPIGVSGKVRSYRTATGWRSRTTVRDLDGRTREVQRTGRTRAASERNLAVAVRDRSQVNPSSSITPETRVSVLAEVWFAEITSLDRSPTTLDAYRDRLNAQILPALGELRVRELTVGRVDRFLASVKATHGPSLAKMTRSVLSGVCGLACRHDALGHNPCRDVAPISVKVKNPPRALSVDEVAQLRTVLANDSHAIAMDLPDLVAIMLATGMRIGEACALRWEDVDLDAGTVAVTGTVLRVKGRGLYRKPAPKSKAGERVLELPSWAIVMLRRRSQTAEVVFPSPRGHLRDPSNTRRAMQQTYKRAGIGHLTSHVYRKTVASLLDDAGLPARAAADQLGHSQVTQTLNTYYGRKSRATGAADVLESLG